METWALVGKVAADLLAGRAFESAALRCGFVDVTDYFPEHDLGLTFSCTSLLPMTYGLDQPGCVHDDGGRDAEPVFELDYSAFGAASVFVRRLRPKERLALEAFYELP